MVFATLPSGIELCCRAPSGQRVARGETVHFAFVPERLHVFDATSRRALLLHGRNALRRSA